MPSLDDERGNLIIRVTYDGTPYAGKTSSLIALADRFSFPIVSPETYGDGRTLFFDWVKFVGGIFDGKPVVCEVVAGPGQRTLGARRRKLVEAADATVFVVDSRRERFPLSLRYLAELIEATTQHDPAIPIVIQANHQDSPTALSEAEVEREIRKRTFAPVVFSIASNGQGVWDAFVQAIRLAIQRARTVQRHDALGRGAMETPEALLEKIAELDPFDEWSGVAPTE